MATSRKLDQLVSQFPFIGALPTGDFSHLASVITFATLEAGQIAYHEEWDCPNYIMCMDGRTRVFKMNSAGREVLIYKVEGGGTCVLTTQCLLSNTNFPAESVAEATTDLAFVPKMHFRRFMAEVPAFRDFVLADYAKLLGSMFSLIDTIAFATVEQRLARRLLVDSIDVNTIEKTHRELAADVGSVREIVSRHLADWERKGWIKGERGKIEVLDRAALAARQPV